MNKLKLWHKVIIGMLLGIACGVIFENNPTAIQYFAQAGKIFGNLLKMIVIPIVFFTILSGLININDIETFGRLGARSLSIYMTTTVFAVIIGISFAYIFKPGIGVEVSSLFTNSASNSSATPTTLADILVNVIPPNPIAAMANGNTMQVVVFAFFTGFAILAVGEKATAVKELVNSVTSVVFKMVELIVKTTPYGVFVVMAWVVGEHGYSLMISLTKLIVVVVAALCLQYLLFGVMLMIFAKINPIPFYKKMIPIQILAFATSSSKATLSLAMNDMTEKMGVSVKSSSFVLPLGTSVNMDATAIYLGICALFFAQIAGIELSFAQIITLVLTSTIGSIGAAGFPGGGLVMMGMVLSSVGLPLEAIPIIIGVDRILDMCRTVINITGDCTVTIIVDSMEKTFDSSKYYRPIE